MLSLPAWSLTGFEASQYGRASQTRLSESLAHFRTWLKVVQLDIQLTRARRREIVVSALAVRPGVLRPRHQPLDAQARDFGHPEDLALEIQAVAGLGLLEKLVPTVVCGAPHAVTPAAAEVLFASVLDGYLSSACSPLLLPLAVLLHLGF